MANEYVRETYRWPLREALAQRSGRLPEDHLILCSSFDLGVATQHAQDSNIPEMVQAIFYAVVMNEVAKWAYREADHTSGIHLLPAETQDGVHQRDDVMYWVRELLQAILGYDVNEAIRIDQNSPYNCGCYLHFNDYGVIVWIGKSRGFFSTKHHCGHSYTGPLPSGEYLLCTSELSFPS
ncbi:hypothetical protein Cgig2_029757 [Carnegiea gigantea]|uniref:Uncharacterized protein n=1 Tax=Carnegiea gigantea TaxID=171969 RepID=A0A9Q1GWF9_9CARY|nr:hypothetical protein Cgig2_029757 [Carnegiea gigantea]